MSHACTRFSLSLSFSLCTRRGSGSGSVQVQRHQSPVVVSDTQQRALCVALYYCGFLSVGQDNNIMCLWRGWPHS